MFGFLVIEGLEKVEGKARTAEYKMAKKIRKSKAINTTMCILGAALMITILSLISMYFDRHSSPSKTSSYFFITLTPTIFLIGFALFLLPSLWQVETGPSYYITKLFAWSGWNSLENLAPGMLAIGPAVMGFATYSSQNNIYFDL